jgi:hypothetical protein
MQNQGKKNEFHVPIGNCVKKLFLLESRDVRKRQVYLLPHHAG